MAHSKEGYSFESFGAVCGRSRSWLYDLVRASPEFKDAKEKGYTASLYNWETLQKAMAGGRLVRISKEVVRTNSKGEPMINPNTGEVLTDKIYVAALGSERALIFGMQCRFEECRQDKADSNQELHNELKDIMEAGEKDDADKRKRLLTKPKRGKK